MIIEGGDNNVKAIAIVLSSLSTRFTFVQLNKVGAGNEASVHEYCDSVWCSSSIVIECGVAIIL